jgi:hypothetical protein
MRGALNATDGSLDTDVIVVEKNNRLEITPRSNVAGRHFNGYMSIGEWDLTNAKTSVEIIQTAEDGADTVFAIGIDSDNWYGFVHEGDTLYLQSKLKGEKTPKSISYNGTSHRFWRFRLDSISNRIAWETSSEGIRWKVEREEELQMDITSVRVTLSAGTYQVTKNPGTAIFDNFRLER